MIGRTISHYRVEAELGRGGMGVVYRAHDQRLRRPVALKVLSGETAGAGDHREKILAEARMASALNHPVITTIYEVGEEGDNVFIVMELVAGRTLRAMISDGRLEAGRLLKIAVQVAEGLGVAHEHRVIHGDIKPENIIVQESGRVKLLDFGIARQAAAETVTMTRTAGSSGSSSEGRIAGTLAYLAPEQWLGQKIDHRADLFSLGVMLYEAAAGHRPFPGPSATSLMSQILHEAPAPLGSSAPGVPQELARIIHRLLEKRPAERHQSAREAEGELAGLARALDAGPAPPAAIAGKKALAVLPFQLLTPGGEDDYLSAALADAVINQLSAEGEYLVRPTSSVMRYAKPGSDPLAAARELNVEVVVDGSIQKIGQRLRAHVQVRNAADGSSLLSRKFDSDIVDLFGLQDALGDAVAKALGPKPASAGGIPTPAPIPPTRNAKAYELFLRAAERLARLNRWDMRTAIELLQSAVELDVGFADAWARLAEAYLQMGVTFEPGPAWFRKAEAAIKRALAIDPNCAEAKAAQGQVLWTPAKRFQNQAALRALAEALRLNPGSQQARAWQGLIFLHVGMMDESAQVLLASFATNPTDARTLAFMGQALLYQGKYDGAEEYYLRALSIDPAGLWSNLFFPNVYLYQRRLEKAAEGLAAARKVLQAEPTLTSLEGLLLALGGEFRKAEQVTARALRGGKPLLHTHHMLHNAACTYALTGKPARALALLKKAAGAGLPNYPAFRDDPHFQTLHSHPGFLRLMSGLKKECDGYRREFGAV